MPGPTQAPSASQQTRYMQGIAVPASSVNPSEFFARTRRKLQVETQRVFAGLGQQDIIELKKTDIIAGVTVRFIGSLVVTVPSGTAAVTGRWPYDLLRKVRFTANGQSNIISCSGAKLKVREFMARGDLNDRGINQTVLGGTVNQGTLSQACEKWGPGHRTGVAAGTYDVDLEWFVPVAEDQVDLAGAIFAATSSTDLTMTLDWATPAELFALTGGATSALTGSVQVLATRYSVPLGVDGQIVVPDLSVFHSLIETRHTSLANGENEPRVVGQGAGKTLLRLFSQLWNGAAQAPVPVTNTNFAKMAWRFGGNETPDEFPDAGMLRYVNERMYNTDIGGLMGFWCHEFASENAFRDAVDLGTTSEFRQVVNIQPGLTLVGAGLEVVSESIFTAGAGS